MDWKFALSTDEGTLQQYFKMLNLHITCSFMLSSKHMFEYLNFMDMIEQGCKISLKKPSTFLWFMKAVKFSKFIPIPGTNMSRFTLYPLFSGNVKRFYLYISLIDNPLSLNSLPAWKDIHRNNATTIHYKPLKRDVLMNRIFINSINSTIKSIIFIVVIFLRWNTIKG